MLDQLGYLEAFITGIVAGFLVSVPVGPINVTIINEGPEKGFRWGVLIGAGSVLMEAIYCGLGFAGFSDVFTSRFAKAAFQLASFVFLVFLGARYMFSKEVRKETRTAQRIEARFDPHTAFMTGFVRVLGNPGVLLVWVALTATFIAHEWVMPNWTSKGWCVAGVVVGGLAWFTLLSYLISVLHRHLTDRTMLWMSRISGAGLLGAGIVIGFKLVVLLANKAPQV
jgi:putative LysE/RhtB family amino acid efflux pump